jgi:hypothetical protein
MTTLWRHAVPLLATMLLMGGLAWFASRSRMGEQVDGVYRMVLGFRIVCIPLAAVFALMAWTAHGTLANRVGMIGFGLIGLSVFCLAPFLQYQLRCGRLKRKLLLWEKELVVADIVSCEQSNWEDAYVIRDGAGRTLKLPLLISGHRRLVAEVQKQAAEANRREQAARACRGT